LELEELAAPEDGRAPLNTYQRLFCKGHTGTVPALS
jgi:hypothetical protein